MSAYPDATTAAFNDLSPATAKFVLKYAWLNSSKSGALVGAGIKPYVNASIDVGCQ